MKAVAEGWCNRRPLIPPKKCRWCGSEYRLVRPNRMACYICATCDRPEGAKRGGR